MMLNKYIMNVGIGHVRNKRFSLLRDHFCYYLHGNKQGIQLVYLMFNICLHLKNIK